MALWQYDLSLIPQARVKTRFAHFPQAVTDEEAKQLHWDLDHQPPTDYAHRLASFLKPAPSWHPAVMLWGQALGNRIDVTTQGGQVTALFARLDARDAAISPFVIRLVDFAQHCGAVFLTDQGHLVPANVRDLLADLRQSPARRFAVEHPELIDPRIGAEPFPSRPSPERDDTDEPAAAA